MYADRPELSTVEQTEQLCTSCRKPTYWPASGLCWQCHDRMCALRESDIALNEQEE